MTINKHEMNKNVVVVVVAVVAVHARSCVSERARVFPSTLLMGLTEPERSSDLLHVV